MHQLLLLDDIAGLLLARSLIFRKLCKFGISHKLALGPRKELNSKAANYNFSLFLVSLSGTHIDLALLGPLGRYTTATTQQQPINWAYLCIRSCRRHSSSRNTYYVLCWFFDCLCAQKKGRRRRHRSFFSLSFRVCP